MSRRKRWRGVLQRPMSVPALSAVVAPPEHCSIRQHSDQMMCGACNLVWDVNDSAPPNCPRTGKPVDRA